MLFMAKPGVTTLYLWTWLLVLYAGVSISSLSQLAWGAAISPEYNQRSRIYAWWQGGNVVGMILVLTLPALLPFVGVKGHAEAVGAMGWFVVLLLPLTVGLAVSRVPEPMITTVRERSGLAEYFRLLKRPAVARILIVDFLVGTGPAITGARGTLNYRLRASLPFDVAKLAANAPLASAIAASVAGLDGRA